MLAPHSVTTVDAEHCGRCVAAESRLRREEERVFVCASVVMVQCVVSTL